MKHIIKFLNKEKNSTYSKKESFFKVKINPIMIISNFLNNYSIRKKVMLAPIVGVFALIFCALMVFTSSNQAEKDFSNISNNGIPSLIAMSDLNSKTIQLENVFSQAIVDRDDYILGEAETKHQEIMKTIEKLYVTEDNKKQLKGNWEKYYNHTSSLVKKHVETEIPMEEFQSQVDAMRTKLNEFKTRLEKTKTELNSSVIKQMDDNKENISKNSYYIIGLVILFIVISFILTLSVEKSVVGSINSLSELLLNLKNGKLDYRAKVNGNDEISNMLVFSNETADAIEKAISESSTVMEAVSRGDYSKRMENNYPGDFNNLSNSMNQGIGKLSNLNDALYETMQELGRGNFNVTMDDRAPKQLKELVNQTVSDLKVALNSISEGIEQMAKGNFSISIEGKFNGDIEKMKQKVNDGIVDIRTSINYIFEMADHLNNGDLSYRLTNKMPGELEKLAEKLNQSLNSFENTLKEVNRAADEVTDGAKEIASGNQDLSQRTEQQMISVDRSFEQLNEILENLKMATENSKQTQDITTTALKLSEQSEKVVNDAILSMDSIQKASKKVEEIVVFIDGIAFQTNLLALNAAVEAARAGEHGKGFAVVAKEVRALSQKTSESSKEIKNLIKATSDRVQDGKSLVVKTGDALKELKKSNEKIATLASSTYQKVKEQETSMNKLHSAFDEIANSNQQNGAMVEEMAAASSSLTNQAEQMKEQVGQFKLS